MKHLTTSDLKFLLTLVERESEFRSHGQEKYLWNLFVRVEDEIRAQERKAKEREVSE